MTTLKISQVVVGFLSATILIVLKGWVSFLLIPAFSDHKIDKVSNNAWSRIFISIFGSCIYIQSVLCSCSIAPKRASIVVPLRNV